MVYIIGLLTISELIVIKIMCKTIFYIEKTEKAIKEP